MKEAIATDQAPKAIGPYSQAIKANGFLFASGQIAIDPATGQVIEGGISEQTERVMQNIAAILTKAGTNFANIVRATVFLKSMSDFTAMNEIYGKHMTANGAVPPARSTVAVAGLPRDVLVEVDVIATV
jgi:2-iminobutanoate/2-iminopropanoate deaminase